ncbi:hypothetical protein MRB53_039860 [Persea americana]|nr:hypothetical protein MRB53_039860 [Persea americana]
MHDTKLSQAGGASFTGQYRRSFGVTNERRSLGYRRSRGSTPGSVLSRSVVLDDDIMDLDSQYEADTGRL